MFRCVDIKNVKNPIFFNSVPSSVPGAEGHALTELLVTRQVSSDNAAWSLR